MRRAESSADRLAVTEVAHAATAPEQPRAWFQALRHAHPRRAEATWWLLEEDGRAVSSLVCHPLELSAGGRVFGGYGVGAVATRPEARRRGHAEALCRRAIGEAEAEGRRVGLLYSAIPPAYYERMGFRALPAWTHECEDVAALAASGPQADLVAVDPRREAPRLAALHERHHGDALHVHRDAAGFLRSLSLNADDLFFGLGDPLRGYVRTCHDEGSLEVVELVVPEAERAAALRAVAAFAVALKPAKLTGWFDPCAEVAAHFRDTGRAKTLPMVRGIEAAPDARFASSDYF